MTVKAQSRAWDVRVRRHTVRVCVDVYSRGGMFSPALYFFLKGPNGSPAGYGPKAWPKPLWYLRPGYGSGRWGWRGPYGRGWSNAVRLPLPCLGWRYRKNPLAARVSRALYNAQHRAYNRLVNPT